MSALIGALRVSLSADTAKFEAGMKRAQRQAKTSAGAISKSMGLLKSGMAGLAAGLSIGLLTNVIKASLDYAGSLGEVAQQLGVTAKELQTFRFAAQQNGASVEEADKALGKLAISMSKALSGSKEAAAAFGAVGVSLTDLRTKSRTEIIGQIADQMKATGGAAANAAAGVAIFGRGFLKIAPTLDQGSAGINNLAAAAEKLGIVLSDEQIAQADATADKLDALKTVLSANIAGVVANNSDAILGLADALVTLVRGLGTVLRSYQAFVAMMNIAGGKLRALDPTGSAASRAEGRLQVKVAQAELRDLQNQQRGGSSAASRAAAFRRKLGIGGGTAAPTPELPQFLAPSGGGGKRGGRVGDPDRARLDALRDAHQFDQELRRAQIDVLRATQDLAVDYVERNTIAVQILDLEKRAYEAELAYSVASGQRTAAQAEALKLEYDRNDRLARDKVLAEERASAAQDSAHLDQVTFDLDRARLESEADLAETAAEQRDVQLRLLDLAYRQERARLAAVLADESAAPAAQEEARRRLSALGETYGNDRAGVMRSTMGPWEEFVSQVPQTADQLNAAFQSVAVQGVGSITDSLTDAIMGAKSLGQAFKEVAKQIIADLVRIMIQKAIVGALGNVLGGMFGGGALPGMSGAKSNPNIIVTGKPGFATGGAFNVLGQHGRDRNMLALNGLPIAKVSHGERVSVSNNDQMGGGRVEIILRDEMLDARIAEGAGVQIIRSAPALVKASAMHTTSSLRRPRLG